MLNFALMVEGVVIATRLDDDGYSVADVMDGNGAVAFDVRYLHQGGGKANLQYCPSAPSPQGSPETAEIARVGAHVLVAMSGPRGVILGGLDSPQIRDSRFAAGTTKEKALEIAQGENYPAAVSIEDQLLHQDGSQVVIGKTAGITLDTTGFNAPVRVQVASSSFLRIAQAGADTTDHVVLSRPLLAKLAELEATISGLRDQAEANTAALHGIPPVIAVPGGGEVLYAAPAIADIPDWARGASANYQASAIRISEQTVGDE
jgi:hypothetical protein